MRPHAQKRASMGVRDSKISEPIRRHVPILVRCLIEHTGDQWQAFTLEYGLAVQGSSLNDVKRRLESATKSYLYDSLVGEDRDHADSLLSRKATADVYFRYYRTRLLSYLGFYSSGSDDHKTYRAPLALEPRLCSP